MYFEQHLAHSECSINVRCCSNDDDAFIHSTNIYETSSTNGDTRVNKKPFLPAWNLYFSGDDKQNLYFYVDECYGEKYSKVRRRIGRVGEVSL